MRVPCCSITNFNITKGCFFSLKACANKQLSLVMKLKDFMYILQIKKICFTFYLQYGSKNNIYFFFIILIQNSKKRMKTGKLSSSNTLHIELLDWKVMKWSMLDLPKKKKREREEIKALSCVCSRSSQTMRAIRINPDRSCNILPQPNHYIWKHCSRNAIAHRGYRFRVYCYCTVVLIYCSHYRGCLC